MTEDPAIQEHVALRAKARQMWEDGATGTEIAELLGVRPQRARDIIARWKAEDLMPEIKAAIALLHEHGVPDEVILMLADIGRGRASGLLPREPRTPYDAWKDGAEFLVNARAMKVLTSAGCRSVADVERLDLDALAKQKGVGAKTIAEIREELARHQSHQTRHQRAHTASG